MMDVLAWLIPVVIAITFHEAAHGFVARRYGDETATRLGRVTLKPWKHIDPVGTLALPGLLWMTGAPVLFGYAKPVPVDFRRLTPRREGMVMVALAGPAMNIFLAILSALLLHLEAWVTPEQAPFLYMMLYRSLLMNVVIALFNLIPLLPLDGGRVAFALLPPKLAKHYGRMEPYGMVLVFALLLVPAMLGFSVLEPVLKEPSLWVIEQILQVTGNGS